MVAEHGIDHEGERPRIQNPEDDPECTQKERYDYEAAIRLEVRKQPRDQRPVCPRAFCHRSRPPDSNARRTPGPVRQAPIPILVRHANAIATSTRGSAKAPKIRAAAAISADFQRMNRWTRIWTQPGGWALVTTSAPTKALAITNAS